MKIKRLILPIFLVLFVLCSCNNSSSPITVFGDGASEYSIVYSSSASDEELDLAYALGILSGEKAPLHSDVTPESSSEILIGKTNRSVTSDFENKLNEYNSKDSFYYLIAEKNGKIVILSNNPEGYILAGQCIIENYVQNGSLIIPGGLCDIQSVTWDEYYLSDIYKDKLLQEDEKRRQEEQLKQLEEELNRYEEEASKNNMTVRQKIEEYKTKIAGFNKADFGEYTSSIFTDAIEIKGYSAPTVYPAKGAHPRVLFTENSASTIRENFEASENKNAYTQYMLNSYVPCDGVFTTLTNSTSHNWNSSVTTAIEAKAFRYAMTGEKLYGYEAIYAIKNAILTLDIPDGTLADSTRAWGYIIYMAGCVYDWCYDLLTEEDKAEIVAGCVNLIGVHMEIVRYDGEHNKAPTAQGPAYGHGSEAQLLRDWLTFAIACYDEYPEIYELVAGRICDDYVRIQDFFNSSGAHWEGAGYGPYRMYFSMYAQCLVDRMTDGKEKLFGDDMEKVAITFMNYIRPDNQLLRIGDGWQERGQTFELLGRNLIAFIAGNYYGNAYLKSISYKELNSFGYFVYYNTSLSPVMVLALNDVSVPHVYEEKAPLVNTTKYPFSSITARSAHNDINAFMVYMTMPESYGLSHAHMDCGSFQIYYKGILASDSGKYSTWGDFHHMSYSVSTISSNSLIIYNPNLEGTVNSRWRNLLYSGGQSIAGDRALLPNSYEEIMENNVIKPQCVSLGVANVEKDGVYLYSYMGGDMTGAYDAETVDEVTRYMLAVATGDSKCPLVFVTFDRITSDDASYRKSALIHMQQEPTLYDDYVIITNTKDNNNGKLVVQSVAFDTEYTIIGGEGKEFWLSDALGNATVDTTNGGIAEYGWGRLEIFPENPEKTNHMLTVMYVTDADNNSAPKKAKDISTDTLAGTLMFGKAMFFPKNDKLISSETSFTLDSSADCYITGVAARTWEIYNGNTLVDTVTVAEGENILTFAAAAGTYTVKPVK